jgi:hypothetical protein
MNAYKLLPLVYLLFSGVVHAQSGDAIKYLMNEPYTLFEIGMNRTQEDLNAITLPHEKTKITAKVDYYTDKESITIWVMQLAADKNEIKQAESVGEAMDKCRRMIKAVKTKYNINTTVGEISGFCSNFEHRYVPNIRPSDLCDKLHSIVDINASVVTKTGERIRCESKLLGGDIYFLD